jgi:hypothetical protein
MEEPIRDQAEDQECLRAAHHTGADSLIDYNEHGVLVRRAPLDGSIQILVPASLRPKLLHLEHFPHTAGHPGITRMFRSMPKNYFWSGMPRRRRYRLPRGPCVLRKQAGEVAPRFHRRVARTPVHGGCREAESRISNEEGASCGSPSGCASGRSGFVSSRSRSEANKVRLGKHRAFSQGATLN